MKHSVRLSKLLPLEFDDIQQEVVIAILKRLETYNTPKGSFLSYLINTFKGDPTDTLQTFVCKKRGGDGKNHYMIPQSLQEVLNGSEDSETTLEDTIEDSSDTSASINYSLMADLRKGLTEGDEQKIFDLIYENPNISTQKISSILHLAVERVDVIRQQIKEKCKKMMGM